MSIEVRNLHKSFGATWAVRGVDLDVREGQMLVLLGPSGCGKTTTMRCIAGLETPDSGRISIGDAVVYDHAAGTDVPVNHRNIGMVFQSYAIWPHMTVFENIAFPLEMQDCDRAEIVERVQDVLKLVGLDGFAERSSSALSGGQMQRVALARSIIMRPSVLLFDEPLSNLDARLRDRLRLQLRELQSELKITGIYVTHDQQEALALADQIMVMEDGLAKQTDDPLSLYSNPATSRIAEFLGYSNIFPIETVETGSQGCSVRLKARGRRLNCAGVLAAGVRDPAVCVRPDDIAIGPLAIDADAGALPDNTIAGTVTIASFMGSLMLYRVRAGEDEIWEVVSTRLSTDIKPGSRVALTIDPSRIHLLPGQ